MKLYLVRHGRAGKRDERDPLDTQRHLDRKGRRQAAWVAERLSGEPIGAMWTSPLPRCVQTLAPLALSLGLPVEHVGALNEGTDIDTLWPVVEAAMAQDHDVVLCSHGDLIPQLIHRAQGRGMHVSGPVGYVKGSFWALTVEDDHIAEGAYLAPPAAADLPAIA